MNHTSDELSTEEITVISVFGGLSLIAIIAPLIYMIYKRVVKSDSRVAFKLVY